MNLPGHAVRGQVLTLLCLLAQVHPCGGQAISVDPVPVRRLEGSARDGTPIFGIVAAATRLRDGTIVVADRSASALKFFDAQGRIVATAGRSGEGPGEFQLLEWVKQCVQDSLFAYDGMRRSISVFGASGDFARQFQAPGLPAQAGCARDGTLGLMRRVQEQPREGATRRPLRWSLSVTDARGGAAREIGDVQVGEMALVGRTWFFPPGSPLPRIGLTPGRLFVCPADSGGLRAYGLTDGGSRSVPLLVPERRPTRVDLERATDALVAYLPPGAPRDTMRQRLLRLPAPERLPACSKVLTDPEDNVWVVLSLPGDSVTVLRVFDPHDRVVNDVSVPAALNVHEVGADYLLASGETPDGEPWVRMYRVRRSPAR